MKLNRCMLVCFALCLAAVPVIAAPTVDFSGYADVRAGFNLDASKFDFLIGRIELTADALILPWLSLEVTVGTYETMDKKYNADLGGAFLSIFKEDGGTKMSLNIGYYDVPFGLASGWYANPENSFMYDPGVTELLTGQWTDLGVYGVLEGEQYSLAAYAVQGDTCGILEAAPTDKGIAAGLRATVSPIEGLTLGISYLLNAHYNIPADNNNLSFLAGDVEWALGPLALAFEYMAVMEKFEFGDRSDAWFAQAMFGLEDVADIPVEFGVRFDYFSEDLKTFSENAITIQANWLPDEHLRMGLSFRSQKNTDSVLMFQVLGIF